MSDAKELKRKVVTGAYWLTGLTFLGQSINWAITFIVIRLLKPGDYGLMAMATVFIGFITLFHEGGLGPAIIQKKELDKESLRVIFGLIILINLGLAIFVFIAAPLLASFFLEPRLIPIFRLLSVNFVLLSFYVLPESLLSRELNFRKKSIIDLISNLLSGVIVLSLALCDFEVWALVWGIVAMCGSKVLLFNIWGGRPFLLPRFHIKGVYDMVSFGGYITLSRILWYFYSQADIIIAGRLFGKELLGLYAVGMQIVSIPLNKISPLFIQIGLPAFSRIQEDLDSIQSNFLKLLRILNLFSFPCFVGIALIAPEAIALLLGPKWTGVIFPIQILCLVMPLRFMSILFPPVLTGRGRPEVITGNMFFAILIMPIAFLIGSKWGVIGLCCSWITAFPILFIIMTKRVLRVLELPFKALLGTFIRPLLGTTVMALCLLFLKWKINGLVPPLWSVMIIITTGIVFYSATVLVINRSALVEIRSIFSTR